MSRTQLSQLVRDDATSQLVFNTSLAHILVPRVSGTQANLQVYNVSPACVLQARPNSHAREQFIKSHFQQLHWTIDEDWFSANTPFGSKPFRNLIVTLNPNACKRLVLACHFDSKYFDSGSFVGATDSAVPCAMLLALASDLDHLLQGQRATTGETLQMIFFDGEEAFVEWSSTDSLYGSRHLADKLNRTPVSPPDACPAASGEVSEIDRIQLLVLLDLLGAPKPSFYSYFPDTDAYYARLVLLERELNAAGLMASPAAGKSSTFFKNRRSFGVVEDDHVPFLRRGVKVLHLITSPFPSVWHTLADDASALHHATIRDLLAILKSFVAEYLRLDVG